MQWIGQVPKHWEVCKVKNKYSFSTGFTPPKNNEEYYDYSNEGYTWVCISDMKAKEIECSANSISCYYVDTFKPAVVKKGSLLYSFKLSVGQVSFAKKDLFTNEAIASFHDLDSVCLPYLYYSSQICIIQNAETNIYGAKLLNQERIKEATILFPPLTEQRAIADWLDAKCADIDAAIELQQRMIDKLKAYKTAVIHQAVTKGLDKNANLKDSGVQWIGEVPQHWEVCHLGSIFKENVRLNTEEKETNALQFRLGEIISKSKGNSKYIPISLSGYNIVEPNVIMINGLNLSFDFISQRVALVKERGVITSTYIAIAPSCYIEDENTTSRYACYLLKAYDTCKVLHSMGRGLRATLSYSTLSKMPILLPPLAEQRAIADWLDAKCADIDATIALKEQKQEKLKEYKKTIIFEYVTGKKQVANINK